MILRLLCIANPPAYAQAQTDIPLSYAQLAAHPEIELFHANTTAMMQPGPTLAATHVPSGFAPDDFGDLHRQPTAPLPLDAFDLAFCRTLKPFPPGYLAHLKTKTSSLRFVNHPAGIERQLEPSFVLDVAACWMPPTIVPRDASEAAAFLAKHQTVVAKRSNSCGGRGVYRVSHEGGFRTDNILEGEQSFANIEALYDKLTENRTLTVLLMRYLPRVTEGDRRIVVVDGEIYGAYLRRSLEGHWVQNLSMGARTERIPVSEQERDLVDATSRVYQDHGIHVLGYDLLQDDDGTWKVSEINAGNIGGLFRLEQMGVEGVTDRFVQWLQKLAHA